MVQIKNVDKTTLKAMSIRFLHKYKAKLTLHKTNDVREDTIQNGDIDIFQALWIMSKDDMFPDEWAMMPENGHYWYPERDLEIIEEIK
jgi:D-mannonate dehydratase